MDERPRVGRLGEQIATLFLERRGGRVLARNVAVGRGEIDVIALVDGAMTAVEVRTVRNVEPGGELFPEDKRAQVRRLGARCGCQRIDLIGVGLFDEQVVIRWFPDVR